jgi:GNAT superfamily N-acetyltransferase
MNVFSQLTREDALQALELGRSLHKESRYAEDVYDDEGIWKLLGLTLSNPNTFHISFCKEGNIITGFFLGTINTEYFTGKKIAVDLGMYVSPSHRGSRCFLKMLKSFETWAKQSGANKIILYHSTGIDPETSKTLFPRLGYEHYGYIFDKEI